MRQLLIAGLLCSSLYGETASQRVAKYCIDNMTTPVQGVRSIPDPTAEITAKAGLVYCGVSIPSLGITLTADVYKNSDGTPNYGNPRSAITVSVDESRGIRKTFSDIGLDDEFDRVGGSEGGRFGMVFGDELDADLQKLIQAAYVSLLKKVDEFYMNTK